MGRELDNGDYEVPNFVVNVKIEELGMEVLIDSYANTEDEAYKDAMKKLKKIQRCNAVEVEVH